MVLLSVRWIRPMSRFGLPEILTISKLRPQTKYSDQPYYYLVHFSILIGLKYKETAQARKAGCEFCYLIVPSSNRPPEKQILPLTFSGTYQVELTCMFPPDVGSKCPKVLKRLKEKWRRKAIKLGDRPTQYSNTPSCDKKTRFGERYVWSLLAIYC